MRLAIMPSVMLSNNALIGLNPISSILQDLEATRQSVLQHPNRKAAYDVFTLYPPDRVNFEARGVHLTR